MAVTEKTEDQETQTLDPRSTAAALRALEALPEGSFFDPGKARKLIADARLKLARDVDDARLAFILEHISRTYVWFFLCRPLRGAEADRLKDMRACLDRFEALADTFDHLPFAKKRSASDMLDELRWDIDSQLSLGHSEGRPRKLAARRVVAELAGLYRALTDEKPSAHATRGKRPRAIGNLSDLIRTYESLLLEATERHLPILDDKDHVKLKLVTGSDRTLSTLISNALDERAIHQGSVSDSKDGRGEIGEPPGLIWEEAAFTFKQFLDGERTVLEAPRSVVREELRRLRGSNPQRIRRLFSGT